MKKTILVAVSILAVLGVVCGLMWQKKAHTVSDFAVFPCDFRLADTIAVSSEDGAYTLTRGQDGWQISAPVQEPIELAAASELNRFLHARMFVDEKREVTSDEKKRLMHERPTKVQFSSAGQPLCSLELGHGYKLPTVDAERRWVFMDEQQGYAWRTFVPLMDFGPLFEQPLAGWRQRLFLSVSPQNIRGLTVWTPGESYTLRADAPKTQDNPQGWRIVEALRDDQPLPVDFDIDARRVATVVELITPFMVDDWADQVTAQELETFYVGGKLVIETTQGSHEIQIGPEIQTTQHPEWARHGEGSRYVRRHSDTRLGIMSARRLLGILPALDDMRTKKIWHLDSTRFAGIDIVVGTSCLRYAPTAPDVWSGMPCPSSTQAPSTPTKIENSVLAMFAKALVSLQAVRYATPKESMSVSELARAPHAQIQIYMDEIGTPSYVLYLSAPVKEMFRYAQVEQRSADGTSRLGPVFVLTESMSRFLLEDLTQPSAQRGF